MALMQLLSPQNDIAFKKIFSIEKNKDILIHFLNDVIERRLFITQRRERHTIYRRNASS